jgi:hypothetical protein
MLIYTSGSTGNPKGVIIDQMTLTHNLHPVVSETDIFGLGAPFFFIAGCKLLFDGLTTGCTSVIIPLSAIREPVVLSSFLAEHDVTVTFISPRVLRYFTPTGSKLKKVITGSEKLSGIYSDQFEIFNTYGQSETVAGVLSFRVDQRYDNTPIGKPMGDACVYLLDENGKDSDEGEICLAGYFAKGYLNLPEETAGTFIANPFKDIDGYNTLVRTGDLGKRLPDGNIVYLNRKDWMIKINGQRVEPGEIETVLNHVPGVAQAAVKDFKNNNGQIYICAYYVPLKTSSDTVTEEMLRDAVAAKLPEYMYPSFYVKLDKMPINPNGKLDRKQLTAPSAENFQSEYYFAPTTETEEKLCNAMAKVLGLKRVGIHDDFYRLGGDSISTIALIVESGLANLSATQVFKGRTACNIARIYEAAAIRNTSEDPDLENEKALKMEHLLSPEQLYMFDYQLYTPESTMYNLYMLIQVDKKEYRIDRLAKAFEKAIQNHPALLTTFGYNEQSQLVQRYTPEVFEKIPVEHLTEFELKFVKDTLVYPYQIVGGRLYRCRAFETEEAGYIFFDVHHTLFDGSSFKMFFNSVSRAYQGAEPVKDYYYLMLKRREDDTLTDYYRESKEYFENRYGGIKWDSHPRIDHTSRENKSGILWADLGVGETQMLEVEQAYHVSRNEFFISVAALSISIYNDSSDILLSWIYNGRNDMLMMSSVGLLFRDLPVGIRLKDQMTIRQIFEDVTEQVRKGIEYCCYPYVGIINQVARKENAYLLYQQNMGHGKSFSGLLNVNLMDIRQNQAASQTIMDMQILDGSEGPKLMIGYSASRYEESSIRNYRDVFTKVTRELVSQISNLDITVSQIRSKVTGNG